MAQMVKNLPAVQGIQCTGFSHWVRKIPWAREWPPTPVFLPGESHGQRSLADYSPRGRKESVTTEQLTLTFSSLRKAGRSLAYVQASCRLVVADYLPK